MKRLNDINWLIPQEYIPSVELNHMTEILYPAFYSIQDVCFLIVQTWR